MNLEELAKQDLFDSEAPDGFQFYDPYRNNNLKRAQNGRNSFENFLQVFEQPSNQTISTKALHKNDRATLKPMLERLKSIESPSKKKNYQQTEHQARKISYSSTQPLKPIKLNSISFKTNVMDCPRYSQSQNLPLSSLGFKTRKIDMSPKFQEKESVYTKDEKVQKLIKQKVAQRQKQKERDKKRKTTTYGIYDGKYTIQMHKKSCEWGKTHPKTLKNLLC